MRRASTPGVNFTNMFTHSFYAHRSQERKKTDNLTIFFFTLLGSARTKAAHIMLMKLTPGVKFTNVFRAAFSMHADPKSTKNSHAVMSVFYAILGSSLVKTACKMYVDEGWNSQNFLRQICKIFVTYTVDAFSKQLSIENKYFLFFTVANINFYWYLLQKLLSVIIISRFKSPKSQQILRICLRSFANFNPRADVTNMFTPSFQERWSERRKKDNR